MHIALGEVMNFYEAIKKKKVKRVDIAQQLKVSPQLIFNWEHGRSQPQLEKVPALAEIFGVTEREVIDWFKK